MCVCEGGGGVHMCVCVRVVVVGVGGVPGVVAEEGQPRIGPKVAQLRRLTV